MEKKNSENYIKQNTFNEASISYQCKIYKIGEHNITVTLEQDETYGGDVLKNNHELIWFRLK